MQNHDFADLPLMETKQGNIVLFYPYVPETAIRDVADVLSSRWIGQGPRVDAFEKQFRARIGGSGGAVAVNSCTAALHLSYLAAGIGKDDEVITPVFTCTATNIPLLHCGAKLVFADVDPKTMNISVEHVRSLLSERTKALVCVHYGGCPCDMTAISRLAAEYQIPVIEDAAQALGGSCDGKTIGTISDFTAFSFQAIKHITTGDGGMIAVKNPALAAKLKRLRWFGIDREAKQNGIWENDITEVGYKYQMTDIAAAMGLAGLRDLDAILSTRRDLFALYCNRLAATPGITVVGAGVPGHAAWLCTVLVENRLGFQKKLREHGIESNQVHFRNDRYTVFGGRRYDLPHMDAVEENYLILPLHNKLSAADVHRVCDVIQTGW